MPADVKLAVAQRPFSKMTHGHSGTDEVKSELVGSSAFYYSYITEIIMLLFFTGQMDE